MPIDIQCAECKKRFRVADKFGGRRVQCPVCREAIVVQAAQPSEGSDDELPPEGHSAEGSDTPAAPTDEPEPRPAAVEKPKLADVPAESGDEAEQPAEAEAVEDQGQWYLQTDDGEQYGPVDRAELNAWLAEGRIDSACQLLCDGWDQWKWADEVFPELVGEESGSSGSFVGVEGPGKGLRPAGSSSSGLKLAPRAADATGGAPVGFERALAETQPWALLAAMVGFVISGLGGLGSGVMLVLRAVVWPTIDGMLVWFVALATHILVGWAAFYLLIFAQRLGRYVADGGSEPLSHALVAQRSFWRLASILATIAFGAWVLTVLLLLILMVAGVVQTGIK